MFEKQLRELISLLSKEAPLWFEGLEMVEPVCCLRVYYFDSHAPYGHLIVRTVYESERNALYEESEDFFDEFWNPSHWFGSGPEVYIGQEKESEWRVEQLLAELYIELGDDSLMERYRAAIGKICRLLNKVPWRNLFPVTDDFVIVMADGSCFLDDVDQDLVESLPTNKYDELVEIGWIEGFEESADDEFAAYYAIENQPIPRRVQSCIEVLQQEASGKDTEVGASAAFELAIGCGTAGVQSLLEFALSFAEQPDYDAAGNEASHQRVVLNLFWAVRDSGLSNKKIEALLKNYLATIQEVSHGKRVSTTLTRHAANCLCTLFSGYPAPESCRKTNRLLNANEFA
ncbi:MAG: hypothetical protein AAFX06_20830 [Planctomycetota bacterium]